MVPFQRYHGAGRMLRKVSLRLISASAHLEHSGSGLGSGPLAKLALAKGSFISATRCFSCLELVWFTLLVNVKFGEQNLGVSPLLTNKP